jgi:hypothetical protein
LTTTSKPSRVPDRRRGQRVGVERREQGVDRLTQLGFDRLFDGGDGLGRFGVLETRQLGLVLGGQEIAAC